MVGPGPVPATTQLHDLGSKSLSSSFLIFKTKQSDEVSSHLLSNSKFYHFTDYSYEGEEET